MTDVDHRGIGGADQRVERHGPLADDQPLGELRPADEPEVEGEGEAERSDRHDHQGSAGRNLNRPVAPQPPYLVT